ncbi:hypothetical protein E3E31_03705 [Thermococcus sp. M39]|uniref:SWIM zinc finger family protein n=1 Tax=unclassified Thermococcus TaxID=2627626 RepID=UPI00143ADC18|nr:MULTISPECIES: SWIM zinc finger family protein [unclassified Thermococcus]NJE07635.1 hypothetical protein [Thermococcus sp. M39]NJE12216.1 hypothetical protein [Thermococcus sp. LS2]
MDNAEKKGKQYFKKGKVLWVLKYGDRLYGKVLGTYPYYVEVSIKGGKSRCTCPIGRDCKHVFAVLEAFENGEYFETLSPLVELSPQAVVDGIIFGNLEIGKSIILKELIYYVNHDESGSEAARLFRKAFALLKMEFSEEFYESLLIQFGEFKKVFYDYELTEEIERELEELKNLRQII